MLHSTMHSPKMTRSLQQISDKFGGSLPSVNKLPNKLHKQQIQDKLHTVQVKVGQQPIELQTKLRVDFTITEKASTSPDYKGLLRNFGIFAMVRCNLYNNHARR